MLVASGKNATIGNNVTVTKAAATFNVNGSSGQASGTLNIASGSAVKNTAARLEVRGDGAVVNVYGTMETTGSGGTGAWLGISGSSGTATVNVETGGQVKTTDGQIRVGVTGGGTGVLNANGGTVTGGVRMRSSISAMERMPMVSSR